MSTSQTITHLCTVLGLLLASDFLVPSSSDSLLTLAEDRLGRRYRFTGGGDALFRLPLESLESFDDDRLDMRYRFNGGEGCRCGGDDRLRGDRLRDKDEDADRDL